MSSLDKGFRSSLGMGLMNTLAMGHSYVSMEWAMESKPCRVCVYETKEAASTLSPFLWILWTNSKRTFHLSVFSHANY